MGIGTEFTTSHSQKRHKLYMYGLDNRLLDQDPDTAYLMVVGQPPWLSHMYRKVSLRSHEDLWVWGVPGRLCQ